MDLDTLLRRYDRLRRELAAAYEEHPWQSGRIDRIANDLAEAEMTLAAANCLPPPAWPAGRFETRSR